MQQDWGFVDFGALQDEKSCGLLLAKDAVRVEDYLDRMGTDSVRKERRDEGKATYRVKGPAVRVCWVGAVTVRAEVRTLHLEMAG